MEYRVKAYNIWEVGQKFDENGRPHQEDALFPPYAGCAPEDRLFVLCDGMGGHDNGEIASRVVCDTMSQSVLRQLRSGSGLFRESIFDKALSDAYAALDAHDTGSLKKMGTTMAFLCLYEKGYFMAHIGDTRIYHIRPGDDEGSTQIIFSTADHSLVNKLVASGKMSLEEAQASTRRHVITRAMQPHMEVRPRADVEMSSDISSGDYFVMCTHGMLDNLSDSEIKRIFSREGGNDGNKFRLLREATANNRDNHSAIIVHIESVISSRAARRTAQAATTDTSKETQAAKSEAGSRSKQKMNNTTRKIISRAKPGGDIGRLIGRLLIGLVVVLTVIMVIYYAFIHSDEAMLKTGRTFDSPFSNEEYDPYKPEEEKYGYETQSSEVIDDRILDDGSNDAAEETAPEESGQDETQVSEPSPEATQEPAAPEPAAPQPSEPSPEPVAPILQE